MADTVLANSGLPKFGPKVYKNKASRTKSVQGVTFGTLSIFLFYPIKASEKKNWNRNK